jgi:hypothetical protein
MEQGLQSRHCSPEYTDQNMSAANVISWHIDMTDRDLPVADARNRHHEQSPIERQSSGNGLCVSESEIQSSQSANLKYVTNHSFRRSIPLH